MDDTDIDPVTFDDEVCVEVADDVLRITEADSDRVIDEAYAVVMTNPAFSDGPYIYGDVQKVGEDSFIQWDMMTMLFRNDIVRAHNDGVNGFSIEEIVRMNEHDYDIGGAVTFGIEALITTNDIQVMLESDEERDVEENPIVTQDGEVIES